MTGAAVHTKGLLVELWQSVTIAAGWLEQLKQIRDHGMPRGMMRGFQRLALQTSRLGGYYPIQRSRYGALPFLGTPQAKRICSVQGLHGRVAVALAAMGADVHVIDFAEENRRYATELADAANVSINYMLCDIMEARSLDLPYKFDVLVLELGILHYHQSIDHFFRSCAILFPTMAYSS